MKKNVFIFAFLIIPIVAYSQIDTEFWFAAPEISWGNGNTDPNSLFLRFISYDEPAVITVSQPANPNFNSNTNNRGDTIFYLEANSSAMLRFFKDRTDDGRQIQLQTRTLTQRDNETVQQAVRNTGLYIKSTSEISVYFARTDLNSEIYSLKGRNALGDDFIVPTQFNHTNSTKWDSGGLGSSVEIVATEDETQATIHLTKACYGNHPANSTFTVNLNKGEAYAFRAKSLAGADHLYNTRITTNNKPIAVNYTDDSVTQGAEDLVGEQIIPLRLVESEYIVVKNPTPGTYEEVYIFPTKEGNTNVYVDDNPVPLVTFSGLGGKFYYALPNPACYIHADQPVIVLQLTSVGRELGGTVLPGIGCSGSYKTAYTPIDGRDAMAGIVTKKENINSFNRIIDMSLFQPVPGTGDTWYYTTQSLSSPSTSRPARLSNSTGVFHLGIFDAGSNTCTYGYFSNYNPVPLGSESNRGYYISGEKIELSVSDPEDLTSVTITFPDGSQETVSTDPLSNPIFTIPVANKAQHSGQYIIDGATRNGCPVEPETLAISIFERPSFIPDTMCLGDTHELTAPGYGPYNWLPSGTSTSRTHEVTPGKGDTTYIYQVENHHPGINLVTNGDFESGNQDFSTSYTYGGSTSTAVTTPGTYTIGKNPQAHHPLFQDQTDHTNGSGNQLIFNCQSGESTLWSQDITNNVKSGTNYEFSAWFLNANPVAAPVKIKYRINGLFTIERDDNGDPLLDEQQQEIETPAWEVPADGNWHQYPYMWKSDATNTRLDIVAVETQAGSAVSIDDIQFAPLYNLTDTIHLYVRDSLYPEVQGSLYICEGQTQVSLTQEYDTYQWSTGSTDPTITITEPGTYTVHVTEGTCSRGALTFTIAPSPEVRIQLNPLPQICSGDPAFNISYTPQSGEVGTYTLKFDEKARQAGFQDIENEPVSNNSFTIPLPEDVRADDYTAELTIYQASCGTLGQITGGSTIPFTVQYNPYYVITQRWNDVLAVTNEQYNHAPGQSGYQFTGYQWYKNGQALEGETNSYLYQPASFTPGDHYSVALSRSDGTQIMSCEVTPYIMTQDELVLIPSLVNASATIPITNLSGESKVSIWDISGRLESVQSVSEENTQITVPSRRGVYILQLETQRENLNFKIIVK